MHPVRHLEEKNECDHKFHPDRYDSHKGNDAMLRELGWNLIVVWECKCMTKKGFNREINRITAILRKV